VDPIGGLDSLEERKFFTLPGLELLPLSRPARNQSLYRLRHTGSWQLPEENWQGKPNYSEKTCPATTFHRKSLIT
jgi:hypothetical protein